MNSILKILADDQSTVKNTLESNLPNTSGNFDGNFMMQVLNWGYVVAGIVAAGFIIFGAWKYISANGAPDKIKSATQTILFSIIGLAIVILAAAITNFIISNVGQNV